MSLLTASVRELTDARALDVSVVDGNGDQLTGFDASRPATATLTSIASSITSVTILASNPARRKFLIVNESTRVLKLAFAATATATAYSILLAANSFYESELGGYTGIITGLWAAVNGNARVTEITT